MEISNQKTKVTISHKNLEYYQQMGCQVKCGNVIEVCVSDLPTESHALEKRICDNCKKEYVKEHRNMLKTFKFYGEDVCPECSKATKYKKINTEKQRQTNLKKYGTEWTMQIPEVRKKSEETCMEKYGVKNPALNPGIKDKIKNISNEIYIYLKRKYVYIKYIK